MSFQSLDQISSYLKSLIDDYWKLEMSEDVFINKISAVMSNTDNRALIMRGPCFKAGFERKMGKKRIQEFVNALIMIDEELYNGFFQ